MSIDDPVEFSKALVARGEETGVNDVVRRAIAKEREEHTDPVRFEVKNDYGTEVIRCPNGLAEALMIASNKASDAAFDWWVVDLTYDDRIATFHGLKKPRGMRPPV